MEAAPPDGEEIDHEGRPLPDFARPIVARRDRAGPGWREALPARVLCTDRRDAGGWTVVVLVTDLRLDPTGTETILVYDPRRRVGGSKTGNGGFYSLENGIPDPA